MTLFRDLLVDSYSGDYTQITDVIVRYLKDHTDANVVVQEIDSKKKNVIAMYDKADTVVNCHMDTVKPSGTWHTDPLTLIETEDRYIGLGTTDTKGNIVASLRAFANKKPKHVMLLFTVDEETSGVESGVTHFLQSEYAKGIKKAFVAEPTGGSIVTKHMGYYSFILKIQTKSFHSSESELSNSAILKASRLVEGLIQNGFNVGKIEGGVAGNIIPSSCMMQVSKRSFQPFEDIMNELNKLIPDDIDVKSRANLPAFINTHEDGESVSFWTEAALFQQASISSVVVGGGSITEAHKENEFLYKSELAKMETFYEQLMDN